MAYNVFGDGGLQETVRQVFAKLKPIVDDKADADDVPASATVGSTGLITFSNSGGTALFTVQLPLYDGSVTV